MLRGKFIAVNAYIVKEAKSQINKLTLRLEELLKKKKKHTHELNPKLGEIMEIKDK